MKVENPYFDKDSKLPTNTTNLMPAQLQKRGKGGHKRFGAVLRKARARDP